MWEDSSNDEIQAYLQTVIDVESRVCEETRSISALKARAASLKSKRYPVFVSELDRMKERERSKSAEEKIEEESSGFLLSLVCGTLGYVIVAYIAYSVLTAGSEQMDPLSHVFLNIGSFVIALLIGALGMPLGGAILIIFSSLNDSSVRKSIERKEAPRRAEHEERIAKMKERDLEEADQLDDAAKKLAEQRAAEIRLLTNLYNNGPLGPGYQTLVAACHVLQFFKTRQRPSIDAALQNYDEERRNQQILDKLDEIIQKLDEIIDNQNMLYRALILVQKNLENLNNGIKRCEASLDRTAIATELSAYMQAKRNSLEKDVGRYTDQRFRIGLPAVTPVSLDDPTFKAIEKRYEFLARSVASDPAGKLYATDVSGDLFSNAR